MFKNGDSLMDYKAAAYIKLCKSRDERLQIQDVNKPSPPWAVNTGINRVNIYINIINVIIRAYSIR